MSDKLKQIEQELDAKIPRDVVSERDGGGGRKLSYLEGWYVIDRLNKIFGPLNWNKEILEVKEVVNKTSRGEFPAYLVKVRLSASGGGSTVVKEAYGYGADKSSQNAHELAIKEAVTYALKVAAKDLGMSLGLALYSKDQENVDEGDSDVEKGPVKPAEVPRTKSVESAAAKAEVAAGAPESSKGNPEEDTGPSTDKLKDAIRSHVRAAIKKGVLTMDEMKRFLVDSYGVESLDPIDNASRLQVILKHVKEKTT